MIKNLKSNAIRKNILSSFIIILLYFLYNFAIVAYRQEAGAIDDEVDKINSSIEAKKNDLESINIKIGQVKKMHEEYLSKVASQKNLTIDANVLQSEIASFIDILNKYYDNTLFKIKLNKVVQNDDYINLAEIDLYFEFNHNLQGTPEVSKEVERIIIKNVYNDIAINFSNILPLEKKLSVLNYENKTVKLFYFKEKWKKTLKECCYVNEYHRNFEET